MKLIKAIGSQWGATAYSAAVSLLLMVAIGRVLGPEKFGIFGYVVSLGTIYAVVQDGGFRTLLFREKIKKSESLRIVDHGHLSSLALGHVILTTLVGLFLTAIAPVKNKFAICIAFIYFGLAVITNFVSSNLKGGGRFIADSGWQIQVRTLTALFVFLSLTLKEPSVEFVILGWVVGLFFSLALPMAKEVIRKPTFRPNTEILNCCVTFLIIDAATAIYFRIDIILLNYMLDSPETVGYYTAAYRLLEGIIMFMTPVAHICFRSLRVHWQDKEAFYKLLSSVTAGMIILALFLILIIFFLGEIVIIMTFGEQYKGAVVLLKWLILSMVFILPNFMLTQAAIAANRERFYAVVAVFTAVLNICLNLWLIPAYGAMGAVWATIFTEGVLCVFLSINLFGVAGTNE